MSERDRVRVSDLDALAEAGRSIAEDLVEHLDGNDWDEGRLSSSHRPEFQEYEFGISFRRDGGKPRSVDISRELRQKMKDYFELFQSAHGVPLARWRLELNADGAFRYVYPPGEIPDGLMRWGWPDEADYRG